MQVEVTPFVVDDSMNIVSPLTGFFFSSSARPVHVSMTSLPFRYAATCSPISGVVFTSSSRTAFTLVFAAGSPAWASVVHAEPSTEAAVAVKARVLIRSRRVRVSSLCAMCVHSHEIGMASGFVAKPGGRPTSTRCGDLTVRAGADQRGFGCDVARRQHAPAAHGPAAPCSPPGPLDAHDAFAGQRHLDLIA